MVSGGMFHHEAREEHEGRRRIALRGSVSSAERGLRKAEREIAAGAGGQGTARHYRDGGSGGPALPRGRWQRFLFRHWP